MSCHDSVYFFCCNCHFKHCSVSKNCGFCSQGNNLVLILRDEVLRSLKSVMILTPKATKLEIVEFANSVDLDEVAHYDPLHLDLLFLRFSL